MSKAVLSEVAAALKAGNVDAAIAALAIEPAAYDTFRTARGNAYIGAGQDTADRMPKRGSERLVIRFDTRAPNAEEFLGTQSSRKVTLLSDDQRLALRNTMQSGLERGDGPIKMARDIVGKIDPKTGRRTGGIIGLSSPQAAAVRNARDELSNPSTMAQFKSRKMRDRRLDRLINAAIAEGRPLKSSEIDLLVNRYSDRLLLLRGETIARTESLTALHAGRRQAYQQPIDEGKLNSQEIRRTWDSTGDGKVRDSHQAVDGEEVGWDEPYSNGLMMPHDPNGPPEEVINCRCDERIRIDFLARVERPTSFDVNDDPPPTLIPPADSVPLDRDRAAVRGERS